MTVPERPVPNLAHLVRAAGASRPGSPAIVSGAATTTYAELDRRSSRVGNAMAAAGVQAGQRVAVAVGNRPEWFEAVLAAAKVGAAAVPISPRLGAEELFDLVVDADPALLVVGPEYDPTVPMVHARIPDLVIWTLGGVAGTPGYEETVAGFPDSDPGGGGGPEDVALLLYTSGTTGSPRGVPLTNDNLLRFMAPVAERWRLSPASASLVAMPLWHRAGIGWALAGLHQEARSVVLPSTDPGGIARALMDHGITNALLVPSVLRSLLAVPGVAPGRFPHLHTLVYGGSPASEAVLRRAVEVLGCGFVQVYGLTETSGGVCQLGPEDHDPAGRPGLLSSCGRPLPWVELRVADPADGREVPSGDIGEVWVRSAQNMKRYWRRPEETAATLTADGWLRTGDLARVDSDGYVFIVDRLRDIIVTGGENVSPAEVERVLARHPAVAEVAVIGVPDERWGEAVKALVVTRPGATFGDGDLVEFARSRLAGYKCPKSVEVVESLPRTQSGKLLRRRLRAPYWASTGRAVG